MLNFAAMEKRIAGDELVAALRQTLSDGTVIRRDEPLSKRTTLRVGGPAEVYLEPASEADLAAALRICHEGRVPVTVLGRGSNLLVRDGGVRGLVVSLMHDAFSHVSWAGDTLVCGAGARLKAISAEAKRHGLSGFEFLEGIPGTLGGALRMNAGAMGGVTFALVERMRFMDQTGQIQERNNADIPVQYRRCDLLRTHVALSATLRGAPAPVEAITAKMHAFSRKRWESQPAAPSAGCIFKNPASVPAGRLIEELGLKGRRVGGAAVSIVHGNFIINEGTATAKDVIELIELIRAVARTQRGLELETEVEIIGEP